MAALPDFGVDLTIVPDLSWRLSRDGAVIGADVWKRSFTPHNSLFYDPTYQCEDVRDLLNETLDDSLIGRWQARLAECYEDSERIASATVTITPQQATDGTTTLQIEANVDTAQGPFTLVLSADALAVTLLSVSS